MKISQYLFTLLIIAITSVVGFFSRHWFDYHSIGFLYLLGVLVVSALFEVGPIFFSALLSALAWNFFFMPPQFSFEIGTTQDILMCYAYFFVACLGGYLNVRIRKYAQERELLKESERLHQILINSISHELRTPLTVMLGNASALMHESMIGDRNFVFNTAKELHQSASRLNQVVENLLDMSRIESDHLMMKREVFQLSDLLESTVSRLSSQLSKHRVVISQNSSELNDLIQGDFKLLDHAIGNLLLNASAYSSEGSEIVVEIFNTEAEVVLRVVDHGRGIAPEYRKKVFEKFFRIPGTPSGGVGLGLSIVKGILEAHQASINILDSKQGTVFEIRFSKAKIPQGIQADWS